MNYSLADIAAASGDNAFGGNSAWLIILLFAMIFGWGNGGFGTNNSSTNATSADIQRAMDLNSVIAGQSNINAELQRGIYEINGATKDAAYNNLSEIRDVQAAVSNGNANIINNLTAMSANMQNCCCTTQRAIDGVNANLIQQSAAIQANDTANTQKVLDAIATNRMADMQSRITSLEMQLATASTVKYPTATTYNAGSSCFGNSCCGM